jgi:uncharacterized protein (TIGR04255 family)
MRKPRPADLPDFDDPPVVEVYLSAQFEPISGFDAGHLGACWEEFHSQFPKAKHQPVLAHELEHFGAFPISPAFQIPLRLPDIQVRLALTSDDEAQLIQIQADRFVHNWRKIGSDAAYPRYEAIREQFETYFKTFCRILDAHNLDAPKIDQCEVSYINHIPASAERGGHAGAPRVFRQLQLMQDTEPLPETEDIGVRARYILRDENNAPFARLHTLMQPAAINGPDDRVFLFSLLVRGRPAAPTIASSFDFYDLGRSVIVRAFAALTTPEMHKAWRRRDAA